MKILIKSIWNFQKNQKIQKMLPEEFPRKYRFISEKIWKTFYCRILCVCRKGLWTVITKMFPFGWFPPGWRDLKSHISRSMWENRILPKSVHPVLRRESLFRQFPAEFFLPVLQFLHGTFDRPCMWMVFPQELFVRNIHGQFGRMILWKPPHSNVSFPASGTLFLLHRPHGF